MIRPLRLDAPAKVNLSLAVTGRRPSGYHELAGAMVLLELRDRLLLLPGCSGLRVEGDETGGEVPLDRRRNLAWRGLTVGLGMEPDLACLALEKRIPTAAGLGGGSSDAAAGWRMGRRAAAEEEVPDAATLAELSSIGADVPFFAAALPAAWVEGIGERLTPLPAPPLHVVLAVAPFRLSTAEVFAELRPGEWTGVDSWPPPVAEAGDNDLLPAALRLRPEIDTMMDRVTAAGGEPRLTGSGPTVFSLSDDPERAESLAARLQRDGLRVIVTRVARQAATIEELDQHEEEG